MRDLHIAFVKRRMWRRELGSFAFVITVRTRLTVVDDD